MPTDHRGKNDSRTLFVKQPSESYFFDVCFSEANRIGCTRPVVLQKFTSGLKRALNLFYVQVAECESLHGGAESPEHPLVGPVQAHHVITEITMSSSVITVTVPLLNDMRASP